MSRLRSSESTTSLGAVALMADTVSIIVMELVDNAIMLVVPGAMSTSLLEPIFWGSLVASVALAFGGVSVNRWLIAMP